MSRALLKTGAALGADVLGGTRLLRRRARRRRHATVLYHHRVVPDPTAAPGRVPAMAISCDTFEWLLDELARHYRFVSLDRVAERRRRGKPPLAISFDDGYRDFYDHAFPILARKGIPATVFVITDLVGTPVAPLHDRLYAALHAWWRDREPAELSPILERAGISETAAARRAARAGRLQATFRSLLTTASRHRLERVLSILAGHVDVGSLESCRLMTWEMLTEIQEAGIGIGSHTRSHVLLPNEPAERVRQELQGSMNELRRRLGPGPRDFSYPDGRFDAASARAVAAAGYRAGFTTCQCRTEADALMTIPRRHLQEAEVLDVLGRRSRAMLACRATGVFDPASPCRSTHASLPSPEPVRRRPAMELV